MIRAHLGKDGFTYQPIAPWSYGVSYNLCRKGPTGDGFFKPPKSSSASCVTNDNLNLNDSGVESARAGVGISVNAAGDKCLFIGAGFSAPMNVVGPSIDLSGD